MITFGIEEAAKQQYTGFNFGLNQNVLLTDFNYEKKDSYERLLLTFAKDETSRQFNIFIPSIKEELLSNPEEAAKFQKKVASFSTLVLQLIKCYVSEQDVANAILNKTKSVGGSLSASQFLLACRDLLPTNYKTVKLDIFLQYQSKESQGVNGTTVYLELPNNVWNGNWVTKAQKGEFVYHIADKYTDKTLDALCYVNESGEIHNIMRSGRFMNSNNAKSYKQRNPASESSFKSTTPTDVPNNTTSSWND